MDIPFYRKKVVNSNDLRWLHKGLKLKNSNHPNYNLLMKELDKLL
jgi:hypothetical protein